MAKSNFKVFAESVADTNISSDLDYEVDTQRISGVVPGIAVPKMHNKLYKQATIMAAAIAKVIVQAGYDALDNDFSKLTENIRHTFAGSVNGVKPDANGNIDLTEVIAMLKNFATPDVGEIRITENKTNPSTKYPGTVWSLLEEGTFIMAAGANAPVGSVGGSNTHTITVEEMAKHNHVADISYAGIHTHTGSTDRTGDHHHGVHGDRWQGNWGYYDTSRRYSGQGDTDGDNFLQNTSTEGAHSHAITLDSAGNHTHTINIQTQGNGKTYDSRPKYRAFYIWRRDA